MLPQPGLEKRFEGRQGLRPVADPVFDLRPQLGHGGSIFRHPEDRVVAEAGVALGLKGDNPGAFAPGPEEAAVAGGQGELADEPGAPRLPGDVFELI